MSFPMKAATMSRSVASLSSTFRVARSNHLAALRFGRFGQKLIDLPLPQDFEVGVWLVK
jgi:hypothetical protein